RVDGASLSAQRQALPVSMAALQCCSDLTIEWREQEASSAVGSVRDAPDFSSNLKAPPSMTPDSTAVQHPRSKHSGRYDFEALVRDTPELGPRVIATPAGEPSIDFSDPSAVKLLNRALLKTHY